MVAPQVYVEGPIYGNYKPYVYFVVVDGEVHTELVAQWPMTDSQCRDVAQNYREALDPDFVP